MVELREVHMQFEQKQVLEGVSLEVQPQERLVIMGQSGSGKSHNFAPDPWHTSTGIRLSFFQTV